MSLFDDVIVNTAAAVDAMSKKATEIVDKSRVRVSSAELKKKISAQFETLGRYVYDTHVTGTTDIEVVNQYTREISDLINELKTLQDSLTASNGKIICTKCKCENPYDSLFCKKCGSSLDFTNMYTVNNCVKPTETVIPEPVVSEPVAQSEPVQDTPIQEFEDPAEVEVEIYVTDEKESAKTDDETPNDFNA